ncbi:hypothetical protein TNCT_519621 [Trichonephila clavata]|uniref:Uncharacterized protein n=1 Tax=Trichonephila clavata TaxID=2740835 RepID=A0A8X6LTE6_TRICU|nr:hypothetical protein TNCT_519621 [Trichonephila clavata]
MQSPIDLGSRHERAEVFILVFAGSAFSWGLKHAYFIVIIYSEVPFRQKGGGSWGDSHTNKDTKESRMSAPLHMLVHPWESELGVTFSSKREQT